MTPVEHATNYFQKIDSELSEDVAGLLVKNGCLGWPEILVSFDHNKFSGHVLTVGFIYSPILEQFGFREGTKVLPEHGQYGISLTGSHCLSENGFDPEVIMKENSLPVESFGTFNQFYDAVSKVKDWPSYFLKQIEN